MIDRERTDRRCIAIANHGGRCRARALVGVPRCQGHALPADMYGAALVRAVEGYLRKVAFLILRQPVPDHEEERTDGG